MAGLKRGSECSTALAPVLTPRPGRPCPTPTLAVRSRFYTSWKWRPCSALAPQQLTSSCRLDRNCTGRSRAKLEPTEQGTWVFSGALDLSTEGTEMKQAGYAGLQPRQVPPLPADFPTLHLLLLFDRPSAFLVVCSLLSVQRKTVKSLEGFDALEVRAKTVRTLPEHGSCGDY